MQRIIELAGVHNYRDLGGLETDTGTTVFGRVIRGESPHHLTPLAFEQLRDMGLQAVIDLRGHSELEQHPNPFATHDQVTYHHIPLFAALQKLAGQTPQTSPPSLEKMYIATLEFCQEALRQALLVVANSSGLVLLHCTAGKDRTGLVAMLLAGVSGASREAIVADYAQTADASVMLEQLRLDSIQNGQEIPAHLLEAKPETMLAVLDYLEQKHGGIVGYVQNSLKLELNIFYSYSTLRELA
ncbi:MAG: hypothetical protein RLZZ156_176 [Deinococcota bacterium]|jgi:protein-tyrosine phosphatase